MLNSFKQAILPYSCKFADEIAKKTRLLHDYFGIECFAYQKIELNGDYICLSDQPDLMTYCLENKIYIDSPYLRHPGSFHSGLIFNDRQIPANEPTNLLNISGKVFDPNNTVAMIQKELNHVELIYMIGKPNNQRLNTLAWNHQLLLKRFIEHFKNELSPIFLQLDKDSINLAAIMPHNFYREDQLSYRLTQELQCNFLKALGYQDVFSKAQILSCREKECLRMLLQGKTAKETAAKLVLSARTVESYLENMKSKLGCMNKSDLFDYAQTFHALNLL